MWTPRRILLLCLGWTLVIGIYLGYGFVLGSIDGLPPLPRGFMPHSREHLPPLPARPASRVVSKLQLAFGPDCPEVSRQIRVEIGGKKMVFAADQFQPEPDGRVSLKPLSVAIFNADRSNPKLTEISTIRGQVAYLKFDRPVTQLSDVGNRKVVAAEISGAIEVTNNRRTQGRDDDLSVFIPTGPLHYADARRMIWTNDSVHLVDNQSKPKPIEVRGKGLEIELVSETPQPVAAGQPKKPKGDAVAGVKRVKLVESVDMHLHVKEDSGFLGQGQDNKGQTQPEPSKATVDQQAYIRIKTPGSFEYFFRSEKEGNLAVFSLPEASAAGSNPGIPSDILVTRHHEARGALDQLLCERLELILRRKETAKPTTPGAASPMENPMVATAANSQPNSQPNKPMGGGTEIESAHATGKEVVLLSDAERLEAHGDDLLFEAKLHRTTLSGKQGMSATLDGGLLKARRLEIEQHKPGESTGRGLKRLVAQGPGQILLKEKEAGRKPSRASWRDTLVSERDGTSERLTLNGQASFTDEQNDQVLNADTLKVWLPARTGPGIAAQPDGKTGPGALPGAVSATPGRKTSKPERVEALGKVFLRSKDIIVHDSHRLMVWFKDVVPTAPGAPQKVLPAMPAPGSPVVVNTPANPGAPAGSPPVGGQPVPGGGNALGLGGIGFAGQNKDPKAPTRPLDLTARSIEAWIFRMEDRSRLDRLRCEGTVQVRQDAANLDDKGLDIRGETLQLTGSPEGNLLTVTGDLAQLRMDRKLIVGPEVNIDEAANKVWVTGIGAIQMESLTNFQGDKLSKPVPMEVHWNKSMLLNGQYAEFHGGIQAEQEQARLACQGLQVYFDKPISLRHGGKGAHVQNLVCDQRVRVEDSTRENGKLVKYQRIVAVTLSMNQVEREEDSPSPAVSPNGAKKSSEIRASGPGEVRILQRGGAEPALLGGPSPGAVPPNGGPPGAPGKTASVAKPPIREEEKQQMKMTYISFQKSMFGSNNRQNKASFLENVRVLNFPCDDPNFEIDIDRVLERMPPEALYLRCDKLDVLSHQENGITHQEMRARGRVVVQARGYSGTGELVTYDEAKGQVIFHGSAVEPAVLYHQLQPGAKPRELKAKKIFYNRITGQIRTDEASSLGGN